MRWYHWLAALAVVAIGVSSYAPDGARDLNGILHGVATPMPWMPLLLGTLIVSAATLVAGRSGFLLAAPVTVIGVWSFQHPRSVAGLLSTGSRLAEPLLAWKPLEQFADRLPVADPLWFAFLGIMALALTGKMLLATAQVEPAYTRHKVASLDDGTEAPAWHPQPPPES